MKTARARLGLLASGAILAVATVSAVRAVYTEDNDWHNACNFNQVVALDFDGYQHSTRVWKLGSSTCNLFYGENWPYTSGGYNIGYSQGWQSGSIAILKNDYNTTHAYGYASVQNPVGNVYSPSLELYVTQ